jgi:hypothetical protein
VKGFKLIADEKKQLDEELWMDCRLIVKKKYVCD